jgi:hypothetical protein
MGGQALRPGGSGNPRAALVAAGNETAGGEVISAGRRHRAQFDWRHLMLGATDHAPPPAGDLTRRGR